MKSVLINFLGLALILLFVASCSPQPTPAVTVLPKVLPTQTLTISSPPATSTKIPISSPTATPLPIYFPQVNKYCPDEREVPLEELGIDDEFQLILSNPERTGLWSLTVQNQEPVLIRNVLLDKWTSYSFSPDRTRIAFTVWNEDWSSSTWVLSIRTGDALEVENITEKESIAEILAPYVTWRSNNELLLFNHCHTRLCYFPLGLINLNNGDFINLPDFNYTPNEEILTFFTNNNQDYALLSYQTDEIYTNFNVFDFQENRQYKVFPWLHERVYFYPYIGTNMGLDDKSSKFLLFLEQSYGFDFGVIEKNFEAMTQSVPYDAIMKRIVTEFVFDNLEIRGDLLDPELGVQLLKMSYEDFFGEMNSDTSEIEHRKIEDAFMAMDYENPINDNRIDYLEFRDYCFNLTDKYLSGVSPDGRIVVISTDDGISLMNLETGYVTNLPHWKYFGWGQ